MAKNEIIEVYGGVTKEEPLSCVDNDLLLKNTCVLEAVSPFFGYFNQAQHGAVPQMVYCVLDGYYSMERLMRATLNIQKKVKFPIDAVTGNITLFNQTCYVIRLLNLHNYSHISMLQEKYIEEGLSFKKKTKPFQNEMAMIKLRRFFSLIPIADGIYFEKDQPNFGYFRVPEHINWDEFKEITKEVKYNTELLYFDAATAYFYHDRSITDLVRIYRENLTEERLIAIKDRYYKILGK
jgi:hypothetical protein